MLGRELGKINDDEGTAVVAAHPRQEFTTAILQHFYDGMADWTETTFGIIGMRGATEALALRAGGPSWLRDL